MVWAIQCGVFLISHIVYRDTVNFRVNGLRRLSFSWSSERIAHRLFASAKSVNRATTTRANGEKRSR